MYPDRKIANDAFQLFRIFWLLFILWHLVISSPAWSSLDGGFISPSSPLFLAANILVFVFGLIALFRPAIHWFVITVALLTAVKLDALPMVPNHVILTLVVHFTILFSFLFYWDRSMDIRERTGKWFEKTAPFLRVELLILYFFVVLHKINIDFFNPEVSCATELYADIAGFYPFFPQSEWIDLAVIALTFLPELIIPVLLIFPATRIAGVLLGLIFHFMLSLHPNLYILSFTAELYALFILFLPAETIVRITGYLNEKIDRFGALQITAAAAAAGAAAGILYLATAAAGAGGFSVSLLRDSFVPLMLILWILWSVVLLAGALMLFSANVRRLPSPAGTGLNISRSPLLLFPLLMILNGLTPYIGLKTATNFAMFSNLRVDGPVNNHLFMSSSWQISTLQNDTVTLLDSDHPYLSNYIQWNERKTWFELNRFLYENRKENLAVTFSRNDGKPQTIRLPRDRDDVRMEAGPLARKLLLFRGIPDSETTPCQW